MSHPIDQISTLDDEVKELRTSTGFTSKLITVLCFVYTALEVAALQFITIDLWIFMALVLIIIMILGYLKIPFTPKDKGKMRKIDWLILIMGVTPCLYIIIEMERLQWTYGSTVLPLDIFFGVLLKGTLKTPMMRMCMARATKNHLYQFSSVIALRGVWSPRLPLPRPLHV